MNDHTNDEVPIDLDFNQQKDSDLSYIQLKSILNALKSQESYIPENESQINDQQQQEMQSQDNNVRSSSSQSYLILKSQTPKSQDQPQFQLSNTNLDQVASLHGTQSKNSQQQQVQVIQNVDDHERVSNRLQMSIENQDINDSTQELDQKYDKKNLSKLSNKSNSIEELESNSSKIDQNNRSGSKTQNQANYQFLNKLTDIEQNLNVNDNFQLIQEELLQLEGVETQELKSELVNNENMDLKVKTEDDEEQKFNDFLDKFEKEKQQNDLEKLEMKNLLPQLNLIDEGQAYQQSNLQISEEELDNQPHQQINFDFFKEPQGEKNQELEGNFAETQRGFDPRSQIKSTIGTPRNLNLYGSMVFNQNKLDRSQQDLKLKNNLQSYQNSMPNSSRGITSRSNQVLLFNKDNQVDQIQKNNYINEESGDEEDMNKKTKKFKKQAKRIADDMSKYQTYTNPDQALKKTIENMTKKNYIKDKFINDKRNTANKFI